jgi:hypothetical protein
MKKFLSVLINLPADVRCVLFHQKYGKSEPHTVLINGTFAHTRRCLAPGCDGKFREYEKANPRKV